MIKNALLIICLLASDLAFSQAGLQQRTAYPKQVVIGSDTIMEITSHQMDLINNMKLNYDDCIEVNDTLMIKLDSCIFALQDADIVIADYSDEISDYKQKILIRDSMINERNGIITDMKTVIKHREKQINKLKIGRGVLGAAAAVLGVILLLHSI